MGQRERRKFDQIVNFIGGTLKMTDRRAIIAKQLDKDSTAFANGVCGQNRIELVRNG